VAAFTDNFAGTNGDDLESRTGWTRVDGTASVFEISSNALKFSTDVNRTMITAPSTGSADHYAQCTAGSQFGTTDGTPAFLCIRATDRNNFIGIRHTTLASIGFQLIKFVTGSISVLGASNQVLSAGDILYLEGSANTITFKQNGTTRITVGSVTDHNTVQTPGVCSNTTARDPWIDNWESNALGGGGGGLVIPVAMSSYRRRWAA
jgi:hypothetical protein